MEKNVWFTNLLLLGFNPSLNEEKFKTAFNRDMFDLANIKGMEVVLHFIFSRINSLKAASEFRDCWPIHDKKQEQSFRRACVQWLANISKEEPESGLPRQAASLLLSPGGDKFYLLLLNLTSHCLRGVVVREHKASGGDLVLPDAVVNGSASVDSSLLEVYEHSLSIGIIRHTQHVVDRLHLMNDTLHPQWRQYALELINDYQTYSNIKKEKKEVLSRLKTSHSKLNLSKPIRENEREKVKAKVRKLWSDVGSFLEATADERVVVESVMRPSPDCHVIDGKDLRYEVPQELVASGVEVSVAKDNTVDLVNLVKTGNIALKGLREPLRQGLPDRLNEEVEFAQNELTQHKSHVQSAQNTRVLLSQHQQQLTKRIDELQKQIETLKLQNPVEEPNLLLSFPPLFSNMNISLSPPSPEPSIGLDTTGLDSTPLPHPLLPNNYAVSTPEAVNRVSQQVTDRARLKKPSSVETLIPSIQKRHSPYHRTGKTGLTTRPLKSCVSLSSKAGKTLPTSVAFDHFPLTPLIAESPLTSTKPSTSHRGPKPLPFKSSTSIRPSVPMSPPVGSNVPVSLPVGPTVPMSPPVGPSVPMSLPVGPTVPLSPPVGPTVPVSPPFKPSIPMSPPFKPSVPVSPSLRHTNGDTTLDSLAEKIADMVCSEDTPYKVTDSPQLIGTEAFVTRERLARTPGTTYSHDNRTHPPQLSPPVVRKSVTPSNLPRSSISPEFNLLENDVPPTPYRDVDLMTPDNLPGMSTRNRSRSNDVIPLILDDIPSGKLVDR